MMNMYYAYAFGNHYDWVDPSRTRSPEEYPYSFDAHYIWRDDLTGATPIYSDRMWEWDWEKAKAAFKNNQRGRRVKHECKEIIERYYDGKYECVGYALCCNVSNGYEIGIFYVREK